MPRMAFTVEIAAPADRVFAFFAPQRMPYWYGAEMEARFELAGGAAEFAVGQKVRISGRLGRKEVSLTAVVTRYEALRLLEWRFHDAYGIRGRQLWQFEPLAPQASGQSRQTAPGRDLSCNPAPQEARTRVRMEDEFTLPGLSGRLTGWLMRPSVAARDRRWLEALRRLAERR